MNVNLIPTELRTSVRIAFINNQYKTIEKILIDYGVDTSHCDSCGKSINTEIKTWFGYVFDNFPEWVNGQNAEL